MSLFQEMLGKCRSSIVVFKVSHVFLESGLERSTCLSGVRHLAVGACQLVYSAFIVLTFGLVFHGKAFTDCVVRGKRNCCACVFE